MLQQRPEKEEEEEEGLLCQEGERGEGKCRAE